MRPDTARSTPLRVLVLEDNPDDADLLVRRLRQAGFDCDWQRVETEADYLAQLSPHLELILADYTLPQYDALRALQHLQARQLDVPFIVVTGMLGEEATVECMKRGAADYLLKDRLARLGPAVVLALEQKRLRDEKRQAEGALRESEERYRTLAEAVQDMIYIIGPDERLQYVNNMAAQLLGLEPEQLTGQPRQALFLTDDADHQLRVLQSVFETGSPTFQEHEVSLPDRKLWLSTWLVPLRSVSGEITAVMGHSRDITQRKRAEAIQAVVYKISQAANAVYNLEDLFSSIHASLGELIPANNFFIALYDPAHDELSFPYWKDEHDPFPPPQKPGRGLTEYVLRTGRSQLVSTEVLHDLLARGDVADVGTPAIDWVGVPLKVEDRLIGVMAVQSYTQSLRFTQVETDILSFVSAQAAMAIERKRAEEAIRYLATTDSLTSLYNRHHFFELARREFKRARRYTHPLSIIMLDIDNLKPINDAEGHLAGDWLIQFVARECIGLLRRTDLLGRYGGDEFVALLPETGLLVAQQVIERLREVIAQKPYLHEGRELRTTISAGLAALDEDCANLEALLGRADRALYAAKQTGKNKVSIWKA
jgi:diguanylate cyclase (GGDEF)-like protein/PAS domain S-box-containing protein